ncbi:MAG: pilus assembly protein [Pseudodonghicola sp.]|nr:pilus assembly protein [Pseudodonghicola sp.]
MVNQIRRFGSDEDGSLIYFGLYVFLIILMFGGIGVDLMQYERDRSSLQYTMDRAVLAAADLDQTLDPESVVRDYLGKAGMVEYLTNVTVDEGLSYRTVAATASANYKTQFMKLSGVDSLIAPAASTAEERIDGVEISLILDVSGSMNSNSKLTNLKVAAKEFVDTMVDNTEDGKMSMSIIPYAQQVSMPADFLDQFNVTKEHNYSNCVNFDSSDFDSAALSTKTELKRTMHFDYTTSSFEGRDNSPPELIKNPVCLPDSSREAMVMQKDATKLKSFISDLWAGGYTSIDLGMKWGTALLDPSIRPAISAMIDEGEVSADFADRPQTYESGETLKVIVLMTDGENTSQYYMPDEYRTGDTGAWWNAEEEVYSVNVGPDLLDRDHDLNLLEDIYYWNELDEWADHPYGNGTYETTKYEWGCTYYNWRGKCKSEGWVESGTETTDEPGTAISLTMGELFAFTTPRKIADEIFEPTMGYTAARNEWYYGPRGHYVNGNTKDTRTKAICDAAKAQDIMVFTIGFEAPSNGLAVLEDCASSSSHFFDVDGLEISDAFASIASSIRKLRLTQ